MNIFSFLQSGLSAVVPFIVLLGILIFVHEFGHFIVARWCGVRVEVFSLGFGKKLLTFKRGDTTYAISLIPLGGYVKMFGEQPGAEISEEDKKVSFLHKNVWQRIAVVLAGPLMNFLFAILVFFVVALMGEDLRSPVVGDIAENTPAYAAGLRSGDTVLAINDNAIQSWEDIGKALSLKEKKETQVSFKVRREGSDEVDTFSINAQAKPNPNVLSRADYIANVEGMTPLSSGTTVGLEPQSPLLAAGMKTGDTITAINGQSVKHWRDLQNTLMQIPASEALKFEVTQLDDNFKPTEIRKIDFTGDSKIRNYSLASLGIVSSELFLQTVVKDSPAEAAGLKPLDRMISINNIVLRKWEDVINNIKDFSGEKPVDITVERGTETITLKITPKMSKQMTPAGVEEKRYVIGISPVVNTAFPDTIHIKAEGLGSAVVRGVEKTWDVTVMTVMSFVKIFQAKISPKNIGGVISIGQAASETFKIGMSQFLQMMAIISVNLFVLNLLPVPVLDGGHLVFYIIEVFKGAPLSMRKMEVAQQVGLAILMSLMIFALFNDFTRILGL
ncbi:zinc metalloprotease [Bdellovibrio bacteriovorus W]|nr:zinc metalloprotease [Bdellovibrio bacteriovorus W]